MDSPADPGHARLAAAEVAALRAYQRLRALRLAALMGRYQPDVFDAAVAAYREAEAALDRARSDATLKPFRGGRSGVAHAGGPDGGGERAGDVRRSATEVPDGSDAAPPLVITNRLRFVKWLVATGRLSDDR